MRLVPFSIKGPNWKWVGRKIHFLKNLIMQLVFFDPENMKKLPSKPPESTRLIDCNSSTKVLLIIF